MTKVDPDQYLSPDFDPKKLTISEISSILSYHSVELPASRQLKEVYIELFKTQLQPKGAQILQDMTNVKASSEGITKATPTKKSLIPKIRKDKEEDLLDGLRKDDLIENEQQPEYIKQNILHSEYAKSNFKSSEQKRKQDEQLKLDLLKKPKTEENTLNMKPSHQSSEPPKSSRFLVSPTLPGVRGHISPDSKNDPTAIKSFPNYSSAVKDDLDNDKDTSAKLLDLTAESGYESESDSNATKSSFDVSFEPNSTSASFKSSIPDWKTQKVVHNDWKNVKASPISENSSSDQKLVHNDWKNVKVSAKTEQLYEDFIDQKSDSNLTVNTIFFISVIAVFFLIRYKLLTIESVPFEYRSYVKNVMSDVLNVVYIIKNQFINLMEPFIENSGDAFFESRNFLRETAGTLINNANQIVERWIDACFVFLETAREIFGNYLKDIKFVSVPTVFGDFFVYIRQLIQTFFKYDIEALKVTVLEKWIEAKDVFGQEIKLSVGNCVFFSFLWLGLGLMAAQV